MSFFPSECFALDRFMKELQIWVLLTLCDCTARRSNLLVELRNLLEISEYLSNPVLLAGCLARENQNSGILRILNANKFMVTTNLLRIIPKLMRSKVVKKRKASKAGRK